MVYIVLGNGFEECEATIPCTVLRRGGVDARFAGIGGTQICGARGITIRADCTVEQIDVRQAEMIVLPGGLGGVHSIAGCPQVLETVRRIHACGGYVAAICAAPTVLSALGLLEGRHATVYPGMEPELRGATCEAKPFVTDGRIVTGRAAGTAFDFALELLRLLRGEQTANEVRESIVYPGGLR